MKLKVTIWFYLIVAAANVIGHFIGSETINDFTKPVLMPLLMYYVYETSRGKVTLRILLLSLAILLSWLGDVALMYQGENIYFLLGLSSFLLAHVVYIIVLAKSSFQKLQFDTLKVLPFAIYTVGLLKLVLPETGALMIPVLIYGVVISVMAGSARLRESNTSQESYRLALYGAILFMISDSLLAINMFYSPLPIAGALIMSTYTVAQLLLIQGILKHVE